MNIIVALLLVIYAVEHVQSILVKQIQLSMEQDPD